MIIKSKSNSYFKCSCKIRVGRCKNLEHPRIFTEYLANSHQKYIERWALSKYTIWPNETSNLNNDLSSNSRDKSDAKFSENKNSHFNLHDISDDAE